MMNDGYLMHHGVKGMKWGVRRNREKAQREYSRLKDSNSSKLDVKVKKQGEGKVNRYRYQQAGHYNKDGTFTEYRVDIKRKTAVGKKNVLKITNGGLGSKTLASYNLTDKDYAYIENEVLKRWGY